jgi:hypothetical protein
MHSKFICIRLRKSHGVTIGSIWELEEREYMIYGLSESGIALGHIREKQHVGRSASTIYILESIFRRYGMAD